MFNRTTLRKFIAPRRQARKVRHLLISPNLGAFASLRESQVSPIACSELVHKVQLCWVGFPPRFNEKILLSGVGTPISSSPVEGEEVRIHGIEADFRNSLNSFDTELFFV